MIIDVSEPFVGWRDMGTLLSAEVRYQVVLVVPKSFGPLGQILGGHESAVLAEVACGALLQVGIQNAGQLDARWLRPLGKGSVQYDRDI
jgi:hypothetical protein